MDRCEVSAAERQLLFGLMALQNGLVDQATLVAAFQAWSRDKGRAMADILIDRGALDADDRRLVEAMVEHHLRKHGSDPERSVTELSAPSVRDRLAALGDAELTAILRRRVPGSTEVDPERTATFAAPAAAAALGDRYRVLRPHARGGLGAVFVALDEELHREVALKQILDGYADDPTNRQRFVLEAEITGRLEHPGVVPVYGLGCQEGERPYYAMRLVRGECLKDALTRLHGDQPAGPRGRFWRSLALIRLLRRFLQVCDAVAYAHSRGVVHRDIKPSNIMLGPFGETLVVDWGLAKVVGRPEIGRGDLTEETLRPASASGTAETVAGTIVGTPSYMSPEQAAGRLDCVGPASDVYSLGATLFALLVGHPPVAGIDTVSALDLVRRGAIPSPRAVRSDLPRALDAICRKAMAHRVEDRYASPTELGRDLERWLADEPVTVFRERPLARAARWLRRNRAWAAAGAATLVLVAIVSAISVAAIGAAWQSERAERLRSDESRRLADARSARLALDRALSLGERHEVGRGLLELVRALELADRAGEPELAAGIRANLANWIPEQPELLTIAPFRGYLLAISPDGSRAMSYLDAEPRSVVFWDVESGRAIGEPVEHDGAYIGSFSPDGRFAVSASYKGRLRLWDAATGRPVDGPEFGHPVPTSALAWQGDGNALLTADLDQAARLWEIPSRQPRGPSPMYRGAGRIAIALSDDGSLALTGDESGAVFLWDLSADPPKPRQFSPDWLGDPVHVVALGPGGRLAAAGTRGGRVGLWEVDTGRMIGPPPSYPLEVIQLRFRADGQVLLTACADASARLIDVQSGQPIGPPMPQGGYSLAVAFSRDGQSVLIGGGDGKLRRWEVATGRLIGSMLEHGGHVEAVAVRPDGRTLATAGPDGFLRTWAAGVPEPARIRLESPSARMTLVAFSPDGRKAMAYESQGGTAWLLDTATGRRIGDPIRSPSRLHSAAFRANGTTVLLGFEQHPPLAWDFGSGREVGPKLEFPTHWIPCVALDRDGAMILVGGTDGIARLRNWETGEAIGPPLRHGSPLLTVALSPDGKVAATGGYEPVVRLWSTSTGKPLGGPLRHRGWIRSLSFDASGRRLLTGSSDTTVRLWDVAEGRPLGPPLEQLSVVFSAALDAEGRQALVGTEDGTLRVWDTANSRPIGPPRSQSSPVMAVAFGLGGSTALVGSRDAVLRSWPIAAPLSAPIARISAQVRAISGLEPDPDDGLHLLGPEDLARLRAPASARPAAP
jgi:WD40 repeat protein/tRNA A-37 threonylcarbamoyl transferase component Bud32